MKGFNSSCGSPTSVNNFISVEQGGKKKKKRSQKSSAVILLSYLILKLCLRIGTQLGTSHLKYCLEKASLKQLEF